MSSNNKYIVIATGGTGGHIFPALGLANYLNSVGFNSVLTSDKRGVRFIDNSTINKTKIIEGTSLNKKNFFSFLKIFNAIVKSIFFLIAKRPKFIFGMGGYASFPLCFSAIILRIPFIIYENNILMGKANRYLAPFAKKIFIAYKDVEGINRKHNNKTIVTGNILREKILNHMKVKEKNKHNDFINILVLGGSQAAKIFAELLPSIFIRCKKNNMKIKILQQCLSNQKDQIKDIYDKNKVDHKLFSFTFDILEYYKTTNLVITRAGSSALAELLNCNIPIITVPLESSAENHQYKNAQYFKKKGYAIMIEERDLRNKLFDLLHSIHEDKSIINSIKQNQNKHTDKNVFDIINKEIKNLFYEN
tara:strand:+ start:952 stop:2037 length:1086 start_codon:yes stop_codon:yes gene_type:complete